MSRTAVSVLMYSHDNRPFRGTVITNSGQLDEPWPRFQNLWIMTSFFTGNFCWHSLKRAYNLNMAVEFDKCLALHSRWLARNEDIKKMQLLYSVTRIIMMKLPGSLPVLCIFLFLFCVMLSFVYTFFIDVQAFWDKYHFNKCYLWSYHEYLNHVYDWKKKSM